MFFFVFFFLFGKCLEHFWEEWQLGKDGGIEILGECVWLRLEYLATRKLVPRFVGFLAVIM